jgi:hypothetical protein
MPQIIKGGDKLQQFLAKVAKQKARVDVGFFPEAKYPDGTQVAEVAIKNEYGDLNIPPRPFMQPTFNEQKSKWLDILAKTVKSQQQEIDVKKALTIVGVVAQDDVKDKIDWWAKEGTPRNAQMTIEKKGFDSPLIETGQMRDAVHFKVTS